ncbi:MAG: hypothetical protein Q7I97_06130 [Thermovirgaceae bacterium]|nr:hypothetical protein [Thermovirgaceae bacterium]
MKLDFIKGHMGGNLILILNGRHIPDESLVLETALAALDRNRLYGEQAGVIYPSQKKNGLKAFIVDITNRAFIPSCGGFTQVLGRALVETDLAESFGIRIEDPVSTVMLDTEAGETPLTIHTENGAFKRVESDMTSFARFLSNDGALPIDLGGIQACKAGYYLVQDASKLAEFYPEADFEAMNPAAVEAIAVAQKRFQEKGFSRSLHFSLYDTAPTKGGDLRAVFPHSVLTGHIEPTCGTGSIALALGLLASGEGERLGFVKGGKLNVRLESGGRPVMGGPDITTVMAETEGGKIRRAAFSHSFIEITAQGKVSV